MIKFVVFALAASLGNAQWFDHKAQGVPRLKDGKPNLSAPAPKKRDLSGIWMLPYSTLGPGGPPRYSTYLAADLPENSVPLRPEARRLIGVRLGANGKDLPFSRCLPAGITLAVTYPTPFKIIQNPGLTTILYEVRGAYRQIFTDGRALPKDPNPTWMGYSIGHWEKDTFVVESNGFNDKTWIDAIGHPHGEKLRLTERYHRRDFGHIELQLTVNDPDWYEKPWSVTLLLEMTPDNELLEDVCLENERDSVHMK